MFSFGKKEEKTEIKKKPLTNTLGIDLGTLNTVVANTISSSCEKG